MGIQNIGGNYKNCNYYDGLTQQDKEFLLILVVAFQLLQHGALQDGRLFYVADSRLRLHRSFFIHSDKR
jgi:hypothetical protein